MGIMDKQEKKQLVLSPLNDFYRTFPTMSTIANNMKDYNALMDILESEGYTWNILDENGRSVRKKISEYHPSKYREKKIGKLTIKPRISEFVITIDPQTEWLVPKPAIECYYKLQGHKPADYMPINKLIN